MDKKYKYFCNCCGWRFESDLPEKDEHGFDNEISCPHCGCWGVYLETPENLAWSCEQWAKEDAWQEALESLGD